MGDREELARVLLSARCLRSRGMPPDGAGCVGFYPVDGVGAGVYGGTAAAARGKGHLGAWGGGGGNGESDPVVMILDRLMGWGRFWVLDIGVEKEILPVGRLGHATQVSVRWLSCF